MKVNLFELAVFLRFKNVLNFLFFIVSALVENRFVIVNRCLVFYSQKYYWFYVKTKVVSEIHAPVDGIHTRCAINIGIGKTLHFFYDEYLIRTYRV